MQEALQTDKCTYILVKIKDGADPAAVAAKINEVLPGNKINLTSDLVIDAQERIPGLTTFLRILVILGAFVSIIFVLLSMYTTITERRKEIGILKSLGASTTFIISSIEGEAFFIGVLGVTLGFIAAFATSSFLGRSFADFGFAGVHSPGSKSSKASPNPRSIRSLPILRRLSRRLAGTQFLKNFADKLSGILNCLVYVADLGWIEFRKKTPIIKDIPIGSTLYD